MSDSDLIPETEVAPVSIWLTFPVIAIALIAFAMGQTVFFVVMPSLARVLDFQEFQVGVMISLAAFIIAAVSPWWGRRSDVWGRRLIIIFGLMAYAITMIGFSVVAVLGMQGYWTAATTFLIMLSIRVIYALFTAGIQPAATAYVAETTSDEHRTSGLAMVSGAIGLGSVLGPVFGGILIDFFGLIGPLVGAAVLAFGVAIAVRTLLPKPAVRRQQIKPKTISFFDPRINRLLLMMMAVMSIGTGAQMAAGFYIIDVLNVDEMEAAAYVADALAAAALAMLVTQGVFVQIFKLSASLMLRVGLLLAAIGFMLVVYPWMLAYAGLGEDLPRDAVFLWIMGGFVCVGVALGLFNPGLMAALSLSVAPDEQGSVAGLLGSAMAGGFVIGPLAATLAYGLVGQAVPFIAGGVLLFILFISSLTMRFTRHP
jgi:MFS family permease